MIKTGKCPANADTQQFLEACDAVTVIRESGDEFEFEYDDQVEVTCVPGCLHIEWDV